MLRSMHSVRYTSIHVVIPHCSIGVVCIYINTMYAYVHGSYIYICRYICIRVWYMGVKVPPYNINQPLYMVEHTLINTRGLPCPLVPVVVVVWYQRPMTGGIGCIIPRAVPPRTPPVYACSADVSSWAPSLTHCRPGLLLPGPAWESSYDPGPVAIVLRL